MKPELAQQMFPVHAANCARRGHHRVNDATPGECGDCGVDLPNPQGNDDER